MKNFFKVLGVIAMVAVIGFSMTACGGDGDGSGGGNVTIKIAGLTADTTYKVGPVFGLFLSETNPDADWTWENSNNASGYNKKTGVADKNGTVTVSYSADSLANIWGLNCCISYIEDPGSIIDGPRSVNKYKIEAKTISLTASDFKLPD